MADSSELIIGVDAGTSVIKAVAFTLGGHQLAASAVPNRYLATPDGAATQDMDRTWSDCAEALRGLPQRIDWSEPQFGNGM